MVATTSRRRPPCTSHDPTTSSTSGGGSRRDTSAATASASPGSPSDAPSHTTATSGREVDEPASEHRRRLVPHLLDGEPGLDDRLGEGVVDAAREPHGRARDDLPGSAGEQPRSDPGRGDEQPEPAGGHCAGSAAVIHSGVVSCTDAVFGS